MSTQITGKELAGLLFSIHHHDRSKRNGGTNKVIYYEEDLLPILKLCGLPAPEWGELYSIQQVKAILKKRYKTTEGVVTTGIEKSLLHARKWRGFLQIDHQTFYICDGYTKKEALWTVGCLNEALKRIK